MTHALNSPSNLWSLSELLRQCVDKGDPVDVANFCAFLLARGESIAPQAQADARDADGTHYLQGARWAATVGNCPSFWRFGGATRRAWTMQSASPWDPQ